MDMQAEEEGVVSVCSRWMMEMSTGHIWTSQKEAMSGLGSNGTADAFPNVAVRPEGVTSLKLTSVVLQAPLAARVQHKQVCVSQISIIAPDKNLPVSIYMYQTFSGLWH